MKILSKGRYYGNQNSERSFNGVLLSHYTYTGVKTDWHYHENPYFMYVLQGNMKDCNRKQKTLCPSGSLMYNNWQEPHYGSKHSEQASGFHLEFETSWLRKNGFTENLLEGSQLIEHPRIHVLFVRLFHEFAFKDTYNEVSVELLLLQLCEALNSAKQLAGAEEPEWIAGLKELLHYDTNKLSLQYLSDQLGVHPVHISRAAPKYLSMSVGEYIRKEKLKKAIPLLYSPSLSLTEIAYQSGFSDQSHFNRVFKSYFGMNPGDYRKKGQLSFCS
ncbi:MAG: helix-turn-helix transcriptional regulator [Bacteroidia bacterium]|nr:helix-turn-helix transcriptional regulator [Bacteroidia bacterium]